MGKLDVVFIKDKAIPISKITEELAKMIEKLIFSEEPEVQKKFQFMVEFSAMHNDKGAFMSGLVISSGKYRSEPEIIEEPGKAASGSTDGAAFVAELEKLP